MNEIEDEKKEEKKNKICKKKKKHRKRWNWKCSMFLNELHVNIRFFSHFPRTQVLDSMKMKSNENSWFDFSSLGWMRNRKIVDEENKLSLRSLCLREERESEKGRIYNRQSEWVQNSTVWLFKALILAENSLKYAHKYKCFFIHSIFIFIFVSFFFLFFIFAICGVQLRSFGGDGLILLSLCLCNGIKSKKKTKNQRVFDFSNPQSTF